MQPPSGASDAPSDGCVAPAMVAADAIACLLGKKRNGYDGYARSCAAMSSVRQLIAIAVASVQYFGVA